MLEDDELVITQVGFGDGVLEISFFETRDQSENAGLMKSLVLNPANFKSLVGDIMSDLKELVDAGLLEIRNPSQSLDPRKRIGGKKDRSVEEEETDTD